MIIRKKIEQLLIEQISHKNLEAYNIKQDIKIQKINKIKVTNNKIEKESYHTT